MRHNLIPSVIPKSHLKQKGIALITVMLIVALAAILAAQMTTRLRMQMQRSENIHYNQQAYWYAMGAEAFAKRVLITSFQDDKNVTNLDQIWAQGETTYPVDFGEITGEITDLHNCLNLNALKAPLLSSNSANESNDSSNGLNKKVKGTNNSPTSNVSKKSKLAARLALEELLIILNIDGIDQFEAESMADALTDWLDENSSLSGAGGAEDNDYEAKLFPYLAANNYLSSVNELRLIEHFNINVIQALKPYVCVLPENSEHKININTLSIDKPELLQALLGSTLSEAQQILIARVEGGFASIDDFYNLSEFNKINIKDEQKDQFVVDSEYFKLKTTASFNNSFFALNSIMKISDNTKIDVISRTIGHN